MALCEALTAKRFEAPDTSARRRGFRSGRDNVGVFERCVSVQADDVVGAQHVGQHPPAQTSFMVTPNAFGHVICGHCSPSAFPAKRAPQPSGAVTVSMGHGMTVVEPCGWWYSSVQGTPGVVSSHGSGFHTEDVRRAAAARRVRATGAIAAGDWLRCEVDGAGRRAGLE
eukprot:CAMPEP_0115610744 /NCGR_PEP_ID=MMETSP0272-20121206/20180_1 /TAXON_ID=71861 /ORGANISM="Scrippsiella trochoidea, Strain CCMP3099" /LENGTH=168 /DNA_ID=CAMNT_0003046465 /DNA_START=87 /DNA_END=591 /DNA_ORIENTATION=-